MRSLLFFILFIALGFWSFGQRELNYGEVGLSAGLFHSQAFSQEQTSSKNVDDYEITLSYESYQKKFLPFGGLFYESKRFYLKSRQKWAFQFSLDAFFYQTYTAFSYDSFVKNDGNTEIDYVLGAPNPDYQSEAFNIAGQINVGLTRKFSSQFYFQAGLGFRLDYAMSHTVDWIQPFSNDSWKNARFEEQDYQRNQFNPDVMIYLRPYFHIKDKMVLGLKLNSPLFPINHLFYKNRYPIPGLHSNYLLRNIFLGISVGLRINTDYDGCSSCP